MSLHSAILACAASANPLTPEAAALLTRHTAALLDAKGQYDASFTLPDLFAMGRLAAGAGGSIPFTCGIINAKSGRCAENCAFCAQSAHYDTGAPVHPLVTTDALLRRAEELAAHGVRYMGIVMSGTGPTERDFDALCRAAPRLAATGICLCASLGVLQGDQARQLKQAGFTSYHHNLETAHSHYPRVCGTHDFHARCETVRLAKAAGLRTCTGGLFGIGESWEQRLELSATLSELAPDSIPVNFLSPIQGTPLEDSPRLRPQEALAIVSLLRLLHPERDIVICGGRSATLGRWEPLLLTSGANGIMVGDYLTTPGASLAADMDMFATLGLA